MIEIIELILQIMVLNIDHIFLGEETVAEREI
jgi:hypothetical protein